MSAAPLPPISTELSIALGHDLKHHLSPAAAWYFDNEWIGVDPSRSPSLPLWLASPHLAQNAKLDLAHSNVVLADGSKTPFEIFPRLESNATFINEETLRYLAQGPLTLRGTHSQSNFVLRSLWPSHWRMLASECRAVSHWRDVIQSGTHNASKPFATYHIWQKPAAETPRYFLGVMLNGAQGDDDEAHGGHLAVVFGRWRENGDMSQWWVANFYNPDVVSEKGILPALTTLDNYLTDVNCGQQHYRPSWLIGCALNDVLPLQRVYATLNDTMNALYSHAFVYQHTTNNCTGLTMDALRYAGLNVPMKGPSSRLLAPFLYLYKLVQERDFAAARSAFQYFNAERTRLLPYVAFKHSIKHILNLVHARVAPATELEHALASSIQGIYGAHFPQIPSARPFGREPVSTVFQYQNRVPAKRENWKIIPVPSRPFPEHLRN